MDRKKIIGDLKDNRDVSSIYRVLDTILNEAEEQRGKEFRKNLCDYFVRKCGEFKDNKAEALSCIIKAFYGHLPRDFYRKPDVSHE